MKFPSFRKNGENSAPMPLRTKLGWILIGLGALVAYGYVQHFVKHDDSLLELNRTFVILFLLWLAWPELEALPRWILILVPICAIVCAWRPYYLVVVIPLTLLYLFLRKPAKSGKKRSGLKSTDSRSLKKNSSTK